MCEPVTLSALAGAGTYAGATSAAVGMSSAMASMLAISAAQTVMQTAAGQEQAKAQQRAIAAGHDNQQALQNAQALQINKQATEQQSAAAREMIQERARLSVASGEAGIAGQSVGLAINDASMRGGQNIAAIESNRASMIAQNRAEAAGMRANAQSKANSVDYPSWIGAGLKIAGAGTSSYIQQQEAVAMRKTMTPRANPTYQQ
jgi:hypothetical protein